MALEERARAACHVDLIRRLALSIHSAETGAPPPSHPKRRAAPASRQPSPASLCPCCSGGHLGLSGAAKDAGDALAQAAASHGGAVIV